MRNTERRLPAFIISLAILMLAAMSAPAQGNSEDQSQILNVSSDGLALDGYSPVSYFIAGQAVRGSEEHSATHDGATYHLVSETERDLFLADPDRYLPAYGGWCAYGLAVNERFPIDPGNFKIVDGRLMLFLKNDTVDALTLWNEADEQQQVSSADENWSAMNQ